MTYTLSNMLRDGVRTLGRVAFRNFTATSGTTTTALNTNFNLVGDPVYTDGDESLVLGTLMVISTTDGLAPQGEYQRISGYTEDSGTITVDTAFTAAIGAGDVCMIIHAQFSIENLIELANQTLTGMGQFYKIDSSLTTSATRNYTLPIAAKGNRPHSIEIEVDTDRRDYVVAWDYITASPGSEATIQFQSDPPTGKTLYITYAAEHDRVKNYDDVISEDIPQAICEWGFSVAILRWQNPSDPTELNAINDSKREYLIAVQSIERWKPKKVPRWAVI